MRYGRTLLTILCLALLLLAAWTFRTPASGTGQARAAAEADHDHEGPAAGHPDHATHAPHDDELDSLFGDEEHADEGHGDHSDHGHDDHAGEVSLQRGEAEEFGIRLAKAGPGRLELHVELPGEIVINGDRQAHVVPRVAGIVREVRKQLGDRVADGEVLAVLESRELADAKAEYLAAVERHELAGLSFQREERLWQKKISAEQEFLDARQAFSESRIALRSAEQKLHTLGFSDAYLKKLPEQPDMTYTRYEIRAPFAGVVIQKHITLGEVLDNAAEAFTVADLSSVWIDISVYQKDLSALRRGQKVKISVGHGIPEAQGAIAYIGPLVGEATRTALARVVLPNPEGQYRPGMFVTARIATASIDAALVVPKTALQMVDDATVVFIETPDGFRPQPVRLGRSNASLVEIVAGLEPGQSYVSAGAFTLKAQLSKGDFGDGHNH